LYYNRNGLIKNDNIIIYNKYINNALEWKLEASCTLEKITDSSLKHYGLFKKKDTVAIVPLTR
jgi:hypothetical protein